MKTYFLLLIRDDRTDKISLVMVQLESVTTLERFALAVLVTLIVLVRFQQD